MSKKSCKDSSLILLGIIARDESSTKVFFTDIKDLLEGQKIN